MTELAKGTYAVFKTNHGEIVVKLFTDLTPQTTENFIGLAEGTKAFTDPGTRQEAKRPFYDGLIFHRVIPEFMIQGGCPLGEGYGDPGYKFKDEFTPKLTFSKPGLLAMANSGPNTNGSQFFITVKETPWLSNRHTIFGEVVEGMDVVVAISKVRTASGDKPLQPVVMEKVSIQRVS